MKAKLILLAAFLFVVAAHCQFVTVNGKIYSQTSSQGWTVLDNDYEVVANDGQEMVCQPFKWITQTAATGQNFAGGRFSTSSQNIKFFSGDLVIFRHSGKMFSAGQDFKEPMKGILTGGTNVLASSSDFLTRKDEDIHKNIIYTDVPQAGKIRNAMIYDMGIPYYPPLTPEQIAARKAAPMIEFQKIESKAEDGNPSARYLLGLRYLNGEGCETNRELAVHWLQKAADAGYPGASEKLATLK